MRAFYILSCSNIFYYTTERFTDQQAGLVPRGSKSTKISPWQFSEIILSSSCLENEIVSRKKENREREIRLMSWEVPKASYYPISLLRPSKPLHCFYDLMK
jgi:hypothetical protein